MNKKKLSKNIGHILPDLVCLTLMITFAGTQPTFAQQKVEPITLNFGAFVPASNSEMIYFTKGFVNKAIELSKGRLAFKFRGGPETIATMDLPKATQSGILDFSINLVGVLETICPGVGGIPLSRISLDEERSNGTYAYINELCNKGGLYYMGSSSPVTDFQFFHLFLKKKVERPDDFKSLRLGTAVVGRAFTEAWGATPVNMVISDYYTAMERGTVDGVSSTTLDVWVSLGCHTVTKYVALPGYLQTSGAVVMNLNIWNKLPPDLQQVVTNAMIYSEKLGEKLRMEDRARCFQKIKEAKAEIYDLPPDTAKWLADTAYSATWAYQMKRFPNETPRLKQLISGEK